MMFRLVGLLFCCLVTIPTATTAQTYQVVNRCIVGNLNAKETVDACAAEGLNCCTGTGTQACFWARQDVEICENSCIDGPDGHGWTCVGITKAGKGSCVGHHSCRTFSDIEVGEGSCTATKACEHRTASVGDGSCTVENGCSGSDGASASGTVGDCVESCPFDTTCPDANELVFSPILQECSAKSGGGTGDPHFQSK